MLEFFEWLCIVLITLILIQGYNILALFIKELLS